MFRKKVMVVTRLVHEVTWILIEVPVVGDVSVLRIVTEGLV